MNPGRYPNLSNKDYHSGPGISKSGLDKIAKSPAHYQAYKTQPHEQTDAMILGSAIHSLVLEPDMFGTEFAVAPEINRRTNDGKAQWSAFQAANADKAILTADQHAQAVAISAAVRKNNAVKKLLSFPGAVEESIFWNELGVLCKCRPDYRREDGIVVDLKSTQDASQDAFMRSIANSRYHVQAAWYLRGVEAMDLPTKAFVFVAIEKEPPYATALHMATDAMLEKGRELMNRDLTLYAECVVSGVWPAYPEEIVPIDLPSWAA